MTIQIVFQKQILILRYQYIMLILVPGTSSRAKICSAEALFGLTAEAVSYDKKTLTSTLT